MALAARDQGGKSCSIHWERKEVSNEFYTWPVPDR